MATRFYKFDEAYPDAAPMTWAGFFHGGTEWLNAWYILDQSRRENPAHYFINVQTHLGHFALELFTKSIICFSDPAFNPLRNGHKTIRNIIENESVSPVFAQIMADEHTRNLVEEFDKTTDSRFGNGVVVLDWPDLITIIDLAVAMRVEMCAKTGLT